MPYNHTLADRMRPILLTRPGIIEKDMFGGIAFLMNGNMCCGIWKDLLVIRLAKDEGMQALNEPHVRPMDITGKPMKGWLFIELEGYKKDADLLKWVERAFTYASSLPPKRKTKKPAA